MLANGSSLFETYHLFSTTRQRARAPLSARRGAKRSHQTQRRLDVRPTLPFATSDVRKLVNLARREWEIHWDQDGNYLQYLRILWKSSQLIVLSPLAEEFKRGEGPGYKGNPEFRGDSESSTQGLNDPDDPWTNLEIGNDNEKDNRMARPKQNLHRSFNVSNFDKDEKPDKDNPSQKESGGDDDKPDEEKGDESDHLPFNITTFEHDGGNSWWAVSFNIRYINSLKMIYLDILHIWNCPTRENENCDLKSIPAPLHGRWQCDDNNNQQSDNNDNNNKGSGTCVLKCDTGYKTSTDVTVRLCNLNLNYYTNKDDVQVHLCTGAASQGSGVQLIQELGVQVKKVCWEWFQETHIYKFAPCILPCK